MVMTRTTARLGVRRGAHVANSKKRANGVRALPRLQRRQHCCQQNGAFRKLSHNSTHGGDPTRLRRVQYVFLDRTAGCFRLREYRRCYRLVTIEPLFSALTLTEKAASLIRSVGMLLLLSMTYAAGWNGSLSAQTPANLRDENLVAWCIVPFDGQQRGPAERAAMLKRLGLRRAAYDWRQKHVPTFEEEILQYKKHGIEYFAFWGEHDEAFKLFQKYDLHPQIWRTLASPNAKDQPDRVAAAAKQMLPLVERTRKLGCRLGLYNHGGWGGEPENMVAVCEYLREHHDAKHVGIVYNQHHGHGHVDHFAKHLSRMQPYLLCLNLNGMTRNGERQGKKILPLGQGEFDVQLLKVIQESGYDGPIGIIGHTQDDVEQRLADNLDGLHWMLPQLDGKTAGPKPELRTSSP